MKQNFKGVALIASISVGALVWIGMHLLPDRTAEMAQETTLPTKLAGSSTVISLEQIRYTTYEAKYRPQELDRNGEDFFNKAISAVVINQWRADTVPNVRACGAEWRDSETFNAMCSGLYDTMIVELDIGSDYAIKKILVPVPLKKPVSIGERVVVMTGSFDAMHETGVLPSITTRVHEMPHRSQEG